MMRKRPMLAIAAGAAAAVGLALVAPSALASPAQVEREAQVAPEADVKDVATHLEEFQSIADANDGNRAAGTEGYAQSAEYVSQALSDAGYEVEEQECGSCTAPDPNIIADWPGGDESTTIMLGAHLDGVTAGAGINDNASGSAALLQAALELAESDPDMAKHVRFGWWADEEQGLNGSADYVSNGGADDVETYINLDMVGSPNAGYFVDNLDSEYGTPFAEHLTDAGMEPEPMEECCSDDASFQQAGIDTVFLSTGAGAVKSEEQAEKWGGTAGESFDPCYHDECDSYPDNIHTEALGHMTEAVTAGMTALAVNASAGSPRP